MAIGEIYSPDGTRPQPETAAIINAKIEWIESIQKHKRVPLSKLEKTARICLCLSLSQVLCCLSLQQHDCIYKRDTARIKKDKKTDCYRIVHPATAQCVVYDTWTELNHCLANYCWQHTIVPYTTNFFPNKNLWMTPSFLFANSKNITFSTIARHHTIILYVMSDDTALFCDISSIIAKMNPYVK